MKIAYLFSGQGSQFAQMGQDLYQSEPVYKQTVDEASDVLDLNFKDAKVFDDPKNVQTAIVTMSTGLFRLLNKELLVSVGACGLSLGEYSALISAVAIDFAPALKLVNDRSHYMAEAGQEHPGKMAAVLKANPQVLGDAIQAASKVGTVVPANFNTDEQVVIGGFKQGVDAASKYLKSHGAKIVIPLKVAVASHTPLMQSASDQLSKRLQSVTFKQPEFPVISNTTSQEFELNDIKQILTEQLIKPTHFENCVRKLFALGADTFIELGPGKTLTKLAMKNLKGKKVNFYHVDSSESLNKLREELGD